MLVRYIHFCFKKITYHLLFCNLCITHLLAYAQIPLSYDSIVSGRKQSLAVLTVSNTSNVVIVFIQSAFSTDVFGNTTSCSWDTSLFINSCDIPNLYCCIIGTWYHYPEITPSRKFSYTFVCFNRVLFDSPSQHVHQDLQAKLSKCGWSITKFTYLVE